MSIVYMCLCMHSYISGRDNVVKYTSDINNYTHMYAMCNINYTHTQRVALANTPTTCMQYLLLILT